MSFVEQFAEQYPNAVDAVLPAIGREQLDSIARHNPGWAADRYDFDLYLRASKVRYVRAVELAERHAPGWRDGRVLDVGGFIGAFPLTLARMGVRVTISEKYAYYYGAFDQLYSKLHEAGVEVWDADLTEPGESLPPGEFGLITNMALIEHLANSPRGLMDACRKLLSGDGRLVIEVPNIAYWLRRMQALAGRSIHPPLRELYESETPFTGHHREYTTRELVDLLRWSGFEVDELTTFNYTPIGRFSRLTWALPVGFRSCRELIMACGRVARQ